MSRTPNSTSEASEGASDRHSGQGDASGRDIVALIDGAIEDWAVSGDAMRWAPEPARTERTERVTHVSWLPAGSIADPARPTIAELAGGVDLTSHVSSVEIRGAEPDLTIIDVTHRWARSALADIATIPAPPPEPVTYDSIMATLRTLVPPQPRPSFVCNSDEYDRIKTGLDERGGDDVELTASPYVPTGTVVRLGPAVQAGIDYRFDYRADFDRDLARYRAECLLRPLATARMAGLFDVSTDLLAYGNAYVDLRPRRAKLRAIHTAYRAKTRRRNRRSR